MPNIRNQPGITEGRGKRMNKNHQASRCRQRIVGLLEHLCWLSKVAQERSGMLRASFYQRRRRCGKRGCRCARGKLHRSMALAIRSNGQSRLVSLEGVNMEKISEMVSNYRRFRQTRAKMVSTFGELLKMVDRMGKLREVELNHAGPAR